MQDPGWSMHLLGKCIVNCGVDRERGFQTIALAPKIGNLDGEPVKEAVTQALAATDQLLWMPEVVVEEKFLVRPNGRSPAR